MTFTKLLVLFVGLPLIELGILIKLGQAVGFAPTFGLVVLTGVIGASLARHQGIAALSRIQRELDMGQVPGNELLDGALILVGGLVLLTPGLLTDLAGFFLLVPASRGLVRRWAKGKLSAMVERGETRVTYVIH